MTKRDTDILKNLLKFRVLTRDHLISMHFMDQKQPITTCNRVMQRLVLKGLVKVNKSTRPYQYMHVETKMKPNSSKVPHFLSIADTYIDMCTWVKPERFEVEPKVGVKGTVEADAVAVWNSGLMFIEIQRSRYTQKVMQEKINRYETYYASKEWKKKFRQFPLVIVLTESPYKVETANIKLFQAKDIDDFVLQIS
jgi:predicted transcriptional regulator